VQGASPELIAEMNRIAEGIFGTARDPEQIPISQASRDKLNVLTPDWLAYKTDAAGNPISWVVAVPTQRELATRFLNKEVSERELLDRSKPEVTYSALYLCSAVTVPAHRGRGIATRLMKEVIGKIPLTPDALLFAWPTTDLGRRLARALAADYKQGISLQA
jgi:hypothetical protein